MVKVYLSSALTSTELELGNVMDDLKEKKIKIDEFSWFNLTQNVYENMTLRVLQNPGPSTFDLTIPKGNYSADELADYIQSALNTASAITNYTVTYNTKTFGFDFVNSTNQFKIVYANSTIASLLGFSVDTSYGLSCSSTSISDLSPLDCIFISCSLVSDAFVRGVRKNILWKISVDKDAGNMIFYHSASSDDWSPIYAPSNQVKIELLDRDMKVITATGVNWNMTLLLK